MKCKIHTDYDISSDDPCPLCACPDCEPTQSPSTAEPIHLGKHVDIEFPCAAEHPPLNPHHPDPVNPDTYVPKPLVAAEHSEQPFFAKATDDKQEWTEGDLDILVEDIAGNIVAITHWKAPEQLRNQIRVVCRNW